MFVSLAVLLSVPSGVIYHGDCIVTPGDMIQELESAQVVFLGEKHDDPFAHQWELFIWNTMAVPGRTLALEMFETDVQPLLNSYLTGAVSEEEFLQNSRPWGNYLTDYAPLVEAALAAGSPVIAANVPRRFAAQVAAGGYETLAEEQFFTELSIDSSSVFYREKFMATMAAMGDGMHGMPMDSGNMYRAQLLKDAVMASSIQGISCVFICGSFHSDHHSGIPDQLPDDVSFLTVKILAEDEEIDCSAADFVIVR